MNESVFGEYISKSKLEPVISNILDTDENIKYRSPLQKRNTTNYFFVKLNLFLLFAFVITLLRNQFIFFWLVKKKLIHFY